MEEDHFFQAIHFQRQCNHMTITSICEYVKTQYMFIETTVATNSGWGRVAPSVMSNLPLHPAITSPHPWEPCLEPSKRCLHENAMALLTRHVLGKVRESCQTTLWAEHPKHLFPLSIQTSPDHRNCLPTNFSAVFPSFLTWLHLSVFPLTIHTPPFCLSSPSSGSELVVNSKQSDTFPISMVKNRKPDHWQEGR